MGDGAAGKVYEAWIYDALEANPPSGKLALKIYEEWLFHREPEKQEERIKRVVNIAKIESITRNQNIVKIFSDDRFPVKDSEEVRALLMEFISGETLCRYVKDRSLNKTEIVDIMKQLCNAVKALHDAGVCHRDIKPVNIMVTKDNLIKLMDFGVVFFPPSSRSTRFVTTRDYAALEWVDGKVEPEDDKAWRLIDIYGIGTVLFDLLMGQTDPTKKEVYTTREQRNIRFEDLMSGSLSDLEKLMVDVLSEDPSNRPQKVTGVDKALSEIKRSNKD